MDIKKTILAGLKTALYVILASLGVVIIGALSAALNYKPEGLVNQTMWTYVVYPAIVALIAALKNYLQHKNDPIKK